MPFSPDTVYKYSIARCTMAVETKFVVVRKGEEKMTFASKKEADAHDKLLDMADAFTDWLLQSRMQSRAALISDFTE